MKISLFKNTIVLFTILLIAVTASSHTLEQQDSIQDDIIQMLDGQKLGEVVVKGSVPTYKQTNEGLQINVGGTVLATVGTADDVLRHIPGLQKTGEGEYELLGRNKLLFLINGREVRDLAELDQLKSPDIKYVTLITSPGARYNGVVRAVVKIQTVKKQGEGLSVDERFVWGQSENSDIKNQIALNYRHGGVDIFGSLLYQNNKGYEQADLTQDILSTSGWKQSHNSKYDFHRVYYKPEVGINWQFDTDNSLGLRYTITASPSFEDNMLTVSAITKGGVSYDLITTNSEITNRNCPTHQANIYFSGKIGTIGVDFNADWHHSNKRADGIYREDSKEYEGRDVNTSSITRTDFVATKLLLNTGLFGGNFTFGTELTRTRRTSDYKNLEGFINNSITENVNRGTSLFAEYTHPLPFGTISTGLRYEHTALDYYKNGVHLDDESKTYNHFLPFLSLSAKHKGVGVVLAYSMKLEYPSYKMLNENVAYINRFTLESGNGLLKPSLINDFSLRFGYKIWGANITYTNIHDAIIFWAETLENENTTILNYNKNIHNLRNLAIALTASPSVGLWRPQLMAAINKQWLTIGEIRKDTPLLILSAANTFRFSNTFTGELTLRYSSCGDKQNTSLQSNNINVTASIIKTFLKERLSVRLAAYDIFRTRQNINIDTYGIRSVKHSVQDTRYAEITLRYTYNITKNKYKGTGAGISERNRL